MNEHDDAVEKPLPEVVTITRRIPLPSHWYLGAHGDPVARFDRLMLVLHPDGSVSWEQES